MRFRPITLVRALLFLSLIQFVAGLSASFPSMLYAESPQSSSVSGKVAAFSERQLTLSVGRERILNTLAFVVDGNTKIEGALVVGAQATVDYRTEGEHFVATRIVATPASGIAPY